MKRPRNTGGPDETDTETRTQTLDMVTGEPFTAQPPGRHGGKRRRFRFDWQLAVVTAAVTGGVLIVATLTVGAIGRSPAPRTPADALTHTGQAAPRQPAPADPVAILRAAGIRPVAGTSRDVYGDRVAHGTAGGEDVTVITGTSTAAILATQAGARPGASHAVITGRRFVVFVYGQVNPATSEFSWTVRPRVIAHRTHGHLVRAS